RRSIPPPPDATKCLQKCNLGSTGRDRPRLHFAPGRHGKPARQERCHRKAPARERPAFAPAAYSENHYLMLTMCCLRETVRTRASSRSAAPLAGSVPRRARNLFSLLNRVVQRKGPPRNTAGQKCGRLGF